MATDEYGGDQLHLNQLIIINVFTQRAQEFWVGLKYAAPHPFANRVVSTGTKICEQNISPCLRL